MTCSPCEDSAGSVDRDVGHPDLARAIDRLEKGSRAARRKMNLSYAGIPKAMEQVGSTLSAKVYQTADVA